MRELRKEGKRAGPEAAKIDKIDEQISRAISAQREALKRAQAIDDTIYDLKAVNPNAVSNADLRTPAQLIEVIGSEGKAVADALSRLKVSLGPKGP